ncbi:MAG: hypothetical protein AAF497_24965, partial [Planctomycetota bacterium]
GVFGDGEMDEPESIAGLTSGRGTPAVVPLNEFFGMTKLPRLSLASFRPDFALPFPSSNRTGACSSASG